MTEFDEFSKDIENVLTVINERGLDYCISVLSAAIINVLICGKKDLDGVNIVLEYIRSNYIKIMADVNVANRYEDKTH